MQQRRQEVQDPAQAWRDIGNVSASCAPVNWAVCGCWRDGVYVRRAIAIWRSILSFREEHLWNVARLYAGVSVNLIVLSLSGSEICFHGKTLIGLVAKAQELPEEGAAGAAANLIDMPGYRKVFKEISAGAGSEYREGLSAELLASKTTD